MIRGQYKFIPLTIYQNKKISNISIRIILCIKIIQNISEIIKLNEKSTNTILIYNQ